MSDLARIFRPAGFEDCPGWVRDDHAAAFAAFRRSAIHAEHESYKSGSLGITFEALQPAFAAARRLDNPGNDAARAFFQAHFVPCHIRSDTETGFVTGFYEPEIAASRVADARFRVPFLRKPDDLEKITDENRPAGFDPSFAFARRTAQGTAQGLAEYDDRRAIEQGSLAGRGLEIAWVEDRIDAFFAHVQGAVRLKFADGAIGSLEATRNAYGRNNFITFEIHGTKGSIAFNYERRDELQVMFADDPADARGFRTVYSGPAHPYGAGLWPIPALGIGYSETKIVECFDFFSAIVSGKQPSPNFEDGYRTERVADALIESGESGLWTKVRP